MPVSKNKRKNNVVKKTEKLAPKPKALEMEFEDLVSVENDLRECKKMVDRLREVISESISKGQSYLSFISSEEFSKIDASESMSATAASLAQVITNLKNLETMSSGLVSSIDTTLESSNTSDIGTLIKFVNDLSNIQSELSTTQRILSQSSREVAELQVAKDATNGNAGSETPQTESSSSSDSITEV